MNMSIAKAEFDGIERIYDANYPSRGKRGAYVYKIPCACCGKTITKLHYREDIAQICDYCKLKIKNKKAELQKELLETKSRREKQFDKAVNEIKKQVDNFNEYEKAINIANKRAEKYGSIPEAMTAIELLKLGYSIIPQQKIGKYKVDFAIPKQKIIIEIDGSLYHKEAYKSEREAVIQLSLGFEWHIIHIPAELIAKNITKLNEVIQHFSTVAFCNGAF